LEGQIGSDPILKKKNEKKKKSERKKKRSPRESHSKYVHKTAKPKNSLTTAKSWDARRKNMKTQNYLPGVCFFGKKTSKRQEHLQGGQCAKKREAKG